jgi:hypothetical protein
MDNTLEIVLRNIMYAVISGVLTLAAAYGLPWLRRWLKNWLIKRLVDAAEQKIKGSGMGPEKKAAVESLLKKLHVRLDELADAMIESAVFDINVEQGKVIEAQKALEPIDDQA